MGASGRAVARERFGLPAMIAAYEGLFEELAER